MGAWTEISKGLTDLPLMLLALIFGLCLRRKGRAGKAALFFLIAFAAALGAGVHAIALPELWRRAVWCLLYALLFEALRRFARLLLEQIERGAARERRAVWLAEGALYLTAVCALLTGRRWDIYPFVAFAALMLLRVLRCLARHGFRPERAALLIALLPVPLALQALTRVFPLAVTLEHLVLLAALVQVYRIARDDEGASD